MKLRRGHQAEPEPAYVTVVTMAKALFERTGEVAFDQFADMVLAATADAEPDEITGKLAPSSAAVAIAQREPLPAEAVASRVMALVAAYAADSLERDHGGDVVLYTALLVARFAEYQSAAGR